MNVARTRERFEVRACDAAELDRAIDALCREIRERNGAVLAIQWFGPRRRERTAATVLCQLPQKCVPISVPRA